MKAPPFHSGGPKKGLSSGLEAHSPDHTGVGGGQDAILASSAPLRGSLGPILVLLLQGCVSRHK